MKQTHTFKAEMSRLMDLVVNSLYQNRDVFLRELISNASDACERMRFLSVSNPDLLKGQGDLGIRIEIDKADKTVTIGDNGVGMNEQEVIDNLGQIASSGTRQFLEEVNSGKDDTKQSLTAEQLIGKFGVGFYAAFLVSDRVDVYTRKAGDSGDQGVHFSTDGRTDYTVESISRPTAGTEVVLHIKDQDENCLDAHHLSHLAKKYSGHISFPLYLPATEDAVVAEAKDEKTSESHRVINPSPAIWLRSSKEIGENEYKEFYRIVGQNFDDPLSWLHCQLEGSVDYKALLYIPSFVPPQMFQNDYAGRVKLYIRRVFVTLDHKILPEWLRFMVGVVEAPNLEMNISREALQNDKQIELIRKSLTKKIIDHFVSIAKNDPKLWQEIFNKYSIAIKQGAISETKHGETLTKLLSFATTRSEEATTLDQYLGRLPASQESIYYLTAPDLPTANASPFLESLKQRKVEVLLCVDPIDEWLIQKLGEFRGKSFKAVHKGEFDLDADDDSATKDSPDTDRDELIRRVRLQLEDKVSDVRISKRLHESPVCLVSDDNDLSLHTKDILRQTGHAVNQVLPKLEINPRHPLIQNLATIEDDDKFKRFVQVLYDIGALTAIGRLNNPVDSARRITEVLSEQAGA